LDANAHRLDDAAAAERIVALRPRAVGFTAVTPTVGQCAAIAGAVRTNWPRASLLLGGPHATAVPEQTLARFPVFDVLVSGEADLRFPDILDRVLDGRTLAELGGVTFRTSSGETGVGRGATDRPDLDSLPFPARDLLPMQLYSGPDGGRMTTLVGTRGCPAKCAYCQTPEIFGRILRTRNPESIADEMEQCRKDWDIRRFNFIDDTFTANQPWVVGLCETLTRRGLGRWASWLCLTRADMVNRDLLAAMRRAGCRRIELGLESGDRAILDSVDKRLDPEQALRAFQLARECRLETLAFVILFAPDETGATLEATRRMIFAADPDALQASFCTPYPGTILESQMRANGVAISEDWNEFLFLRAPTFAHPRFRREEMIAWQRSLLRAFYFRPRTVFRLLRSTLRHGGWRGFLRSAYAGARDLLAP
jgi:radical SAM superfamily enzyme YgiQ (UPF0313 family)